jgi:peptidoglycan/LPS O-acetylase OafA/YrhL
MKRAHLIFGAILVVVFLLTGQYMDKFHHHLRGMPDGPRMLYRTRHIFILFSGLLNLGIGTYIQQRKHLRGRMVQWCGSGLIALAAVLFITAFFYEPTLTNLKTPLSHWAMYAIVAGVALHLLSGAGQKNDATTR